MRIRVQVERLVLEGLPLAAADRERLSSALATELTARLTAGGLDPALLVGGALAGVAAPPVHIDRDETAPALGSRIARSVYRGLGPSAGSAPSRADAHVSTARTKGSR